MFLNIYKKIDAINKFKKAIKNRNLKIFFVKFVRNTLQSRVSYIG